MLPGAKETGTLAWAIGEETSMFRCITIAAGLAVLATTGCLAQNSANEQGREIPGYFLPLPDDISPEMRPLVAAPPAPWDIHPKNIQEWKELVAKVAGPAKTLLPAMREKLGVQLEPSRSQV
jgi:hypothetical protein